ncbi:hypothetical protein F4802DRAFT_360430 [Xylaria palmicola]|nr:hypothetical protein F4802DRAFT_360430 [Xylaria palmicola]
MLEAFKVQDITALDGDTFTVRVRPIVARLPLRLRSPDVLYYQATDCPSNKRVKRRRQSSRATESCLSPTNADNGSLPDTDHNDAQEQHTASKKEKQRKIESSKVPVEWLDRILETSYGTRNPISPKLCVSKATMAFLHKSKTCIFVGHSRADNLPGPLRCYPGFRAALVDICDRFGHFYAPFAAYNAHTREITLFPSGTPRPTYKFLDADTAYFDLELARSAWVRPAADDAARTFTVRKGTSPETSEGLTEVSDRSQADSDETLATELEGVAPDEPDEQKKRTA